MDFRINIDQMDFTIETSEIKSECVMTVLACEVQDK